MMPQISALTLLFILIVILVTMWIYKRIVLPYQNFAFYKKMLSSSYKTLVHPYSILGIGTFGIYRRDYLKHGDSQYTIKRQYPSYQISLANFKGKTYIDFIDTELIKEFYERQMEGCYIKALTSPFSSSLKHLIGNGLVFSQGEEWKMKKKIMSQVFNYDFIKSKIALIANISHQKLNQAEHSEVNENQKQVKIDVNNLLQRIFGNVVVKSFFGDIQLDKIDGSQLFAFVNNIFELNTARCFSMFAFFVGPNFYKYNLRKIDRQVRDKLAKFKQFARDAILDQIEKVKRQGKPQNGGQFNGIIELLIRQEKLKTSQEDQRKQGQDYYTVDDLIDEFTTFFTAGIDTTTNSTSVLVYLLAQHPNVQAKVRKEMNEVFPSPFKTTDITYENLKKLTYFDDVARETLRMYSPNAGVFPRQTVKDHFIGTIPIKKGTLVSVKVKPNHFKDQFYQNPLEFRPERWSERDPTKIDQFSYFPFSSGKRNCIGQHLALLQSKIAVISLLKRYTKITLEKPEFKMYMRTLYGPEQMITTFQKNQL